jgi:hypothetical protein
MLAVLAIAVTAVQPAQGDDTTAPPAGTTVVKKRMFSLRRLPNYYGKVATEEQKEKIHKIQEEYQPKIDELHKQLEALTKERDEKVAAVLRGCESFVFKKTFLPVVCLMSYTV